LYQLKKTGVIHQLIFPRHYRSLPQRRLLLNIFRSIHILCFSILVGGLYFDQSISALNLWALSVIISGVALFLVDFYGSGVVLFEVRGFTVFIKIILLIIAYLLPPAERFNLLVVVIIFSSFVSHSPRWLRHKTLLPVAWLENLSPEDGKSVREKSI
jgi:TM2 domain-containing membrane protein YozV